MEQKKKLLIFTDTYKSQINGAKVTLEALINCKREDLEIIVVSSDAFHTVPFPTYKEVRFAIVTPRKLKKILKIEKPDMIHIATEGTIGFAAARACQKLRVAYTSAFHTKFPEYISIRMPFVGEKFVHKVLRYIHDTSSHIIVSSPSMQEYLEKNFYIKNNIQVIPFGVDHETFSPGEKTLFLDLPKPILLFVGRIAIEKNIGDFLAIETTGTKIVVGDGPLKKSLEHHFPEVLFLGKKSPTELASIYRSADVFVFPSLTDTFGLVNIEALACGLPVLAYDVEGPQSIITHGQDGILVTYGRGLTSGLASVQDIDTGSCIQSTERYSWDNYIRLFLECQILIPQSIWS